MNYNCYETSTIRLDFTPLFASLEQKGLYNSAVTKCNVWIAFVCLLYNQLLIKSYINNADSLFHINIAD